MSKVAKRVSSCRVYCTGPPEKRLVSRFISAYHNSYRRSPDFRCQEDAGNHEYFCTRLQDVQEVPYSGILPVGRAGTPALSSGDPMGHCSGWRSGRTELDRGQRLPVRSLVPCLKNDSTSSPSEKSTSYMWIVRLALPRPYTVALMCLLILVLGILSLTRMTREPRSMWSR